jgi:hypothetical protein
MKVTASFLFLCLLTLHLSGTTAVFETYESLAAGDPEPNFAGIGSNYPPAVLEVRAETAGSELFRPGNTRYFHWETLSGINPDAAGSGTQFYGGPSTFNAFSGGAASVVSYGFDFMLSGNHAEILFGVGQPPTSRGDDQNFGPRLVIRGNLGITGKTEILANDPSPAFSQTLKNGVPYRVEVVANDSGSTLEYNSPIGPMQVATASFDVFLMNIETGVYNLLFDDSPFWNAGMAMEGFWWTSYPYTNTGRAIDIRLDNIAVHENEIVFLEYDSVRPGPASAYIDFESVRTGSSAPESLWYHPGSLVQETPGAEIFGSGNGYYFDTSRVALPGSWTGQYSFSGDLELLTMGLDIYVDRDPVIAAYDDAHDEVYLAFSGGDTIANAGFTSYIIIRGTRSVGNDANPAEAEPTLLIQSATPVNRGVGFDWSTPYRMQILFNQSGFTQEYDTPWATGVQIGNEMVHLHLYNYSTGQNVEGDGGTPYYLEGPFNNGLSNTNGARGTLSDCRWKNIGGRRTDLHLDNITILENVLSVTHPQPPEADVIITDVSLLTQAATTYQGARNLLGAEFELTPGTAWGVMISDDLSTFTDLNTYIPALGLGQTNSVEIPLEVDSRFLLLKAITR